MLFIKFIILLIIFAVVTVVISILLLLFKLKRAVKRFSGEDFSQANTSRSGSFNGSAGGTDNYGNAAADEKIYNGRNPQNAQRKIIPKDEGEYIDFEEVKE